MKKPTEADVSFEQLYSMLLGQVRSKLFLAGIELEVFNQLSEPISSDDVAKAIDTHPVNTRFFLDGLAACGLVTKKRGLYQNTPTAEAFLVEGRPTFLGQLFVHMSKTWHNALDDLPRRIEEGPPSSSPGDGSATKDT